MNKLRRITITVLVLCMILCSTASADIKRGDTGEDVAALQQLLFEDGWLFAFPDGIFGAETEQAVMNFEAFANLPVDGIADPLMIYELYIARDVLYEENGLVPEFYYDFEGVDDAIDGGQGGYADNSFDPNTDGPVDYAECCTHGMNPDGSGYTEYCRKHNDLHAETYAMLDSGDPEQARNASDMWYAEVINLYDEWAMLQDEADRDGIYASRATYLASVDTQRNSLNYETMSAESIVMTEVSICNSLRYQAIWLCGLIWQEENAVTAADTEIEPLLLNELAAIDSEYVYYAGNIIGYGDGVFAVKHDGSGLRMISDISCVLVGICDGYLLVWDYTNDDGMLKVLYPDGTLEPVGYSSNWSSLAHEGRFYFGGTSVEKNGYDHQWILSSDPERHDNYYPVAIADGYMYFLDVNDCPHTDVASYQSPPANTALKRLNIASGEIEFISGYGTKYIGIEDGRIYYTRTNYHYWDESSENYIETDIDEGLFATDTETMTETRLAGFAEADAVFDTYIAVENGVIYGERADYSVESDFVIYSILRVNSDGTRLTDIPVDYRHSLYSMTVKDGTHYAAAYGYFDDENGYTSDMIIATDIETGDAQFIPVREYCSIFFVESNPNIAVFNGRIYYICVYNDTGCIYVMSMNADGSDAIELIESSYY